jgi:hypothetical protein
MEYLFACMGDYPVTTTKKGQTMLAQLHQKRAGRASHEVVRDTNRISANRPSIALFSACLTAICSLSDSHEHSGYAGALHIAQFGAGSITYYGASRGGERGQNRGDDAS